ncbi:MAG: hypothetical protein DWQ20_06005 [Actinobacteria bacterium]|nr:MAG: hypothetical protein DWQ20_06005 [Actinomycetota bacterium]
MAVADFPPLLDSIVDDWEYRFTNDGEIVVTVDMLQPGTFGQGSISVADGADLRSANYVAATSGWIIEGDGDVEFNDGVFRGTIGSSTVDETIDVSATGDIESDNYVATTTGWHIDGDGNAEFNSVTVRGILETSTISGDLTLDGTGAVRTDSSGQRVELDSNGIRWFNSDTDYAADVVADDTDLTIRTVGDVFSSGTNNKGAVRLEASNHALAILGEASDVVDSASTILELSAWDDLQLRFSGGDSGVAELQLANDGRYGWTADTDTYMHRDAGGQIAFTCNDDRMVLINQNALVVLDQSNNAVMGLRGEDGVIDLPVKTTTGDPSSPNDGWMYVNTADNAVRVYADGAWRDLATW